MQHIFRCLSLSTLLTFSLQPLGAETLENFEGHVAWRAADWGDEAKVEVSSEQFTEGQKSLKVYWLEGAQRRGKGIVIERDISALSKDFSTLRLDVMMPEVSNAQMAMAVDSDEYFESQTFPLESGWNKDIAFYLNAKTWKAKTTSWQYQTAVNLATAPKKIYLLFYLPEQATGRFYIDNIRVTLEQAPKVTAGPQAETLPVRTKKNHYRPRELPLEIFIRP